MSAHENYPTCKRLDSHFSLSPPDLTILARGDLHVRSRFIRSTIPEEKQTTRSLNSQCPKQPLLNQLYVVAQLIIFILDLNFIFFCFWVW